MARLCHDDLSKDTSVAVSVRVLQKTTAAVTDPGARRDLAHTPHFMDKEYRQMDLIVRVYTGELE